MSLILVTWLVIEGELFQENTYVTGTRIRVRDTPRRHLMQIDDFQNGRLNGRASPFNIGTCLIIHCPYHDYRSFILRLRVEKLVGYQSASAEDQTNLFVKTVYYET